MTYTREILVVAAIAVPHLLRLDLAQPGLSALIWLVALVLRAMAAVIAAILIVLYLPRTAFFDVLTHSHWEIGVPGVDVSIDGHLLGAFALALQALILAVLLLFTVAGLWLSTRGVARLLRAAGLRAAPGDSLVLADGDVLIAAAGIRFPRIVVSAGALLMPDDAELAASLEHERGPIALRHRYLLLPGDLCCTVTGPLPRTRAAGRELLFHVERDADHYAIRGHDPAVLSSAICKAAQSSGSDRLRRRSVAASSAVASISCSSCRRARAPRTGSLAGAGSRHGRARRAQRLLASLRRPHELPSR